MFKILLSISLFLATLKAHSQIQWYYSLEAAKVTALAQNKLILVDFTASWCGPCKKMDLSVWPDKTVDSLAQRFISAKIDIDRYPHIANQFNVTAIPRIMIINAFDEVFENHTGYIGQYGLPKLLRSYPANVQIINKATVNLKQNDNPNNFMGYYQLGLSYQEYVKLLIDPAKQVFYKRSMEYLRQAEKIAHKQKQKIKEEKALLAQCFNHTLIGRQSKAIKKIENKIGLDKLEPTNKGFAYLVLAISYYKEGNKSKYEAIMKKLEKAPAGTHFKQMVKQQCQ